MSSITTFNNWSLMDHCIIGKHELLDLNVPGSDDWNEDMEKLIGTESHITNFIGFHKRWQVMLVSLDVDSGMFAWRLSCLTRPGMIQLTLTVAEPEVDKDKDILDFFAADARRKIRELNKMKTEGDAYNNNRSS